MAEIITLLVTHRSGVILGFIGAHADTETTVKSILTIHDDELNLIPHSFIVIIRRGTILQHDFVQTVDCMNITSAKEHKNSPFIDSGFCIATVSYTHLRA